MPGNLTVRPAADAGIALGDSQPVADVPRRLFGSFVEHLGRCVYGGIYEPDHPTADADGFRGDVLDLVRELGVTCVRYPGGNFVSNYRWEDGTGPRDRRPVRRDLAWHTTETNEVGIDDFYRWSRKAGTEIMLAVNMGTRGLEAALDELEYVNGAPGTALADRRVANGIPEPMGIRMWCIGNEMDGPWQVGHMTADAYATEVERVAHAMKLAESGLELVACGSSSAHMPTFGDWERTVLTRAYAHLSFVSCHAYYYDRGVVSTRDFLASGEDMKTFIGTVAQAADEARNANDGDHDIALSFDEWGVWYSDVWNAQEDAWRAGNDRLHNEPWPRAPHLLEDVYTARDAVVEGSLMITLLSNCDRVRSASRAQLVNVIAPIMTEPGGGAWRQTVFYPFAFAAHHCRGMALKPSILSPSFDTDSYGAVDAVEAVATWDAETRRGCLLMTNRDEDATHTVTIDLRQDATDDVSIDEAVMLHDDDPTASNTAERPDRVTPAVLDVAHNDDGTLTVTLPAVTWAGIAFTA